MDPIHCVIDASYISRHKPSNKLQGILHERNTISRIWEARIHRAIQTCVIPFTVCNVRCAYSCPYTYDRQDQLDIFIYLRVYSLHHNVLPTLQSIPLMTNRPLYPITQDSSCHGQHTMPRNPCSFPWPVPHSCVCINVCVLQWRKVYEVVL